MVDDRRIRLLRVSRDILAAMFRQRPGGEVIFEGLPDDAYLVNVCEDFLRDVIVLKFRSASFSPVEVGDSVPELTLTCAKTEAEVKHPWVRNLGYG